ncbi:MAG: hypothetical protein U0235_05440 [Polyangiaceae bacterium]
MPTRSSRWARSCWGRDRDEQQALLAGGRRRRRRAAVVARFSRGRRHRLWRDLGYAFGALFAGVTADVFGLHAAMGLVAAITFASGGLVARRMRETLRRPTSTHGVPPRSP